MAKNAYSKGFQGVAGQAECPNLPPLFLFGNGTLAQNEGHPSLAETTQTYNITVTLQTDETDHENPLIRRAKVQNLLHVVVRYPNFYKFITHLLVVHAFVKAQHYFARMQDDLFVACSGGILLQGPHQ